MVVKLSSLKAIFFLCAFVNVGMLNRDLLLAQDRTFGEDVQFLAQHIDVVLLGGSQTAQVVVAPAYQGRVMTSTATGDSGLSYGWINYEQVAKGVVDGAQINVFGGEERFWLGPEGGQFSIFFAPGAEFSFDNWQTPALIDTHQFEVVKNDRDHVALQHDATVHNYSKTTFELRIQRDVELLNAPAASESLGVDCDDLSVVGYRTRNRITNRGPNDWTKESGLLSVWLLGMYKHGPETTVVIPYRQGSEATLGPVVNDAYFGKVPADRLKVDEGVLYFSGDGQYRSKIGLSPHRSTPVCGSFDAARNVLTIVKYNQPGPDVTDYVNSMWEIQQKPFAGDVVNAYNDGPPKPGAKPLGPFYELETSSPAFALTAGESGEHIQETFHIEGNQSQLDVVSRAVLGVTLDQIRSALE